MSTTRKSPRSNDRQPFDKLSESQQKLGQAIYSAEQQPTAPEGDAPAEEQGSDEDIVDAEVVDDEEEPKK